MFVMGRASILLTSLPPSNRFASRDPLLLKRTVLLHTTHHSVLLLTHPAGTPAPTLHHLHAPSTTRSTQPSPTYNDHNQRAHSSLLNKEQKAKRMVASRSPLDFQWYEHVKLLTASTATCRCQARYKSSSHSQITLTCHRASLKSCQQPFRQHIAKKG